MTKGLSQKSTQAITLSNKPAGKKLPATIGRRKFFKLSVGVGASVLPYVIPTIYTFTVPKNALACHMGVTHGMSTCG